MKGSNLGELEEIMLLIVIGLADDAYGLRIKEEIINKCRRSVSLATIHSTLHRLEAKGYLKSHYEKSTEEKRSGRPKLVFAVTSTGKTAIQVIKEIREELWANIPSGSLSI